METKGRAHTDEQKRDLVERILRVWQSNPGQRLGQMIFNKVLDPVQRAQLDVFYVEDEDLVRLLEIL